MKPKLRPVAARKPTIIERVFGFVILLAAIAVLVVAPFQWLSDTARIRQKATVKIIKTVAPLRKAWQLDLPAEMKDPRFLQSWNARDAQLSIAAQDAASGLKTPVLSENQVLTLIKGTDGTKETQALALVDTSTGRAVWEKTYADLPLDYCLPVMWQSQAVCESRNAKKIVKVDPAGNVTVGELPNGIWDLATGAHVLGTVFDRFLVVPVAVSENSSAGADAVFINPDFTYKGRFQVLSPGAVAAKPLLVQSRGAVTLVGVLTASANGSNRRHTWSFSQLINTSSKKFDLDDLGATAQMSLLEAGFFASADPENTGTTGGDSLGAWRLYHPDGTPAEQGRAPMVALQALHSQLRAGLTLDLANATKALQSGKVPVVMPDKTYFLASAGESCVSWPGCTAEAWTTGDGVRLRLKTPSLPLASDGKTVVFNVGKGLDAYGMADGKKLWEGIIPPLKGATLSGAPLSLGGGIAQLAQIGLGRGTLTFWRLP